MSVTAERKSELIKDNATKDGDTGSPEVQIAILTERINNLTEHCSLVAAPASDLHDAAPGGNVTAHRPHVPRRDQPHRQREGGDDPAKLTPCHSGDIDHRAA